MPSLSLSDDALDLHPRPEYSVTCALAIQRFRGGNWTPTPLAEPGETTRDALGFCSRYWPEDVVKRVTRAAEQPGGWAIRGPVGETVFLYAPQQGLAARIRYGD